MEKKRAVSAEWITMGNRCCKGTVWYPQIIQTTQPMKTRDVRLAITFVTYIHTYVRTYVRTYICMYICSLIIEKKKSELRDTQGALVRHSTSFYMNMGSLNKLPQRAVYPV